WPELGRTVPDGDRAMTAYGRAGSGEGSRWLRSPLAGPVVHRYWLVAALSVFDTRTDTTLARLMIRPFWSASRSYFAWVKTRLRRSSSALAMASSASRPPPKSSDTTETSSPPTG